MKALKHLALILIFCLVSNPAIASQFLLYGPYVPLSAGEYELTLEYMVKGVAPGGTAGFMDAVGDEGMQVLGSASLTSQGSDGSGQSVLRFKTLGLSDFECRVRWPGIGTLLLKKIKLTKIEEYSDSEALGTALIMGSTNFRSVPSENGLLTKDEIVEWNAADKIFIHDIGRGFGANEAMANHYWMITESEVKAGKDVSRFYSLLVYAADQMERARGWFSRIFITLLISLLLFKSFNIIYFRLLRIPRSRLDYGYDLAESDGMSSHKSGQENHGIKSSRLPEHAGRAILMIIAIVTIVVVAYLTRGSYEIILAGFEKTIAIWAILLVLLRPIRTSNLLVASMIMLIAATIFMISGYENSAIRLGNYAFFVLILATGSIWRDMALSKLMMMLRKRQAAAFKPMPVSAMVGTLDANAAAEVSTVMSSAVEPIIDDMRQKLSSGESKRKPADLYLTTATRLDRLHQTKKSRRQRLLRLALISSAVIFSIAALLATFF